jgi:hypothetical protein
MVSIFSACPGEPVHRLNFQIPRPVITKFHALYFLLTTFQILGEAAPGQVLYSFPHH